MSQQFGPEWGNPKLTHFIETQAPVDPSWLPSGDGWWLLLALGLVYLGLWGRHYYRRYQANRYRRDALRWLEQLPGYHPQCPDARYQQLPTLLRSVALQSGDRHQISQLRGNAWEQWLDSQCPGSQFAQQCPGLLQQLAYQPTPLSEAQINALCAQIRHWIGHHRSRHD